METQNVKVCYVVNTNEEVKSIYKIDDTPDKRNDARDQGATAFSAYSYSFYPERWKEEPVFMIMMTLKKRLNILKVLLKL